MEGRGLMVEGRVLGVRFKGRVYALGRVGFKRRFGLALGNYDLRRICGV